MNERGFAVLDTVVSIFLLSIIVIIVMGFKPYLLNHKSEILKHEEFYTNIDKELSHLYSSDWNYEDRTVMTKAGEMSIKTRDEGENEFKNNVLTVEFQLQNLKSTFELERSQYYDE